MSAAQQIISTGYAPREHQRELHLNLKRFSVLICHRRFGKSVFAVNTMVDRALKSKRTLPRFFYIAPNYAQAKRIVWDMLKFYTSMIPGVEYNEAELRIDFTHNQARIQLLSAENPASLKGIYSDLTVLDEYGDMAPVVWSESVRPTLSDRRGEAIFIGTVKGVNHFWELYEWARDENDPEWFAALFKASETKIIPADELASARKTMSEESYASEYECDPLGGLVGAYFAKEMSRAHGEGRIGIVPHDPMLPVDTYWDLGMNDSTVVWFVQSALGGHRFIDHYETSGQSIPEVLAEVNKRPYQFDEFVLPHDAAVRDLSTGRTRQQQFYSLGCRKVRLVPRVGAKMESINAARVLLRSSWFDKVKCKDGIKALQNYKKAWDDKRQTFADTPLHDWASNSADAYQTFAMGLRPGLAGAGGGRTGDQGRSQHTEAETDYDPYSRRSLG